MPMHDAAGATVGFVKILRDQTEERRNQEAQDRSRGELLQAWHENEGARREAELQKEHLASLFTQAPAPICILRGPSYIVEFANAHMCQLWGRAQEEVIGKPVFEAVQMVRGTVIRGLLDSVLATGTPQTGKEVSARLDRKGDGTLEDAYLNFTYAPLRDVAGRIDGVLAMASDVTDEVRAREQMSELHEMEQAASRAKDDFLAMLGHELRNPLAPLRTSLYLIRKRMPPSPADSLLDIADRQAGNLSRIVDDLLEAARIGEGKIDLRLERIDLGASVRQALEASQGFLNSQQHQVNVTLPKRGLYVNADPVRIEQIVLNLLNNAGKYTPAGGRIDVGLKRVGKFAELRVADNGIGIPEELRPRLFQIFQQGNRDLAREEGGLGVGLNVVRRLVDLHGGSVHALSEGPGKGSEFVVRLPIAAEAHSASEVEPPDAPVAKNAAPRRVLVVDDNRDAGETLAMLIDSLGHETRIASDGPTAVRLADEWSPDIVFLDIGLPGMDGYEVAREIRLRHRDQPPRLVAVTGYGQDRDREKTRDAGFDEHLVKPADFKAIAAMLAALEAESSDRAA
jgi:PAS domain S-box-containing protein